MFFEAQDKYQIRHRALLEAVRFCGGVTAYSKLLNVSRSRVSNWLNQHEINIPYEYVLLTEDFTQVSIERLSPFTEVVNKVVRRRQIKGQTLYVEVLIDSIIIEEPLYNRVALEGYSIIMGTDGILISGLSTLKAYQLENRKKVPVIAVDLDSLLLGTRMISDINPHFLTSERVAIGLRLEKLLGNRRGKRCNLESQPMLSKDGEAPLRRKCDYVKGRTDSYLAKLVGLMTKDTYHRAKQVYLHGDFALIRALDRQEISIGMAAKIVKTSKNTRDLK